MHSCKFTPAATALVHFVLQSGFGSTGLAVIFFSSAAFDTEQPQFLRTQLLALGSFSRQRQLVERGQRANRTHGSGIVSNKHRRPRTVNGNACGVSHDCN